MLNKNKIPKHVAIIMDGNGRWAKKRGLPRVVGHNAGMIAMKKIVRATGELDIDYLTVYAFSTENWKRSYEEVSSIFNLIIKYVNSELKELVHDNVHINIIGNYKEIPKASADKIEQLIDATAKCDGLKFNIALNYGGRAEIARGINNLIKDKEMKNITEDDISNSLFTGKSNFNIPDPDMIIRTGGEKRLSNFLIWQAAYSEFMFTDTLWPDFKKEEFISMIEEYGSRDRRFGGRTDNEN